MQKIVSIIFIILILIIGLSPNIQSRTLDMLTIPIKEPSITATKSAEIQRFYAYDENTYGKMKEKNKKKYNKFMKENYPGVKFKILKIKNTSDAILGVIGQKVTCFDTENKFEFTIYYENIKDYFEYDIKTGFLKIKLWSSKYLKMYSDYLYRRKVNMVVLPEVAALVKNTKLFDKVEVNSTYFDKRCITPEIVRKYIKYVGTPISFNLYLKNDRLNSKDLTESLTYLLNMLTIRYPEVSLVLRNDKSGININLSQLTYKSLKKLNGYKEGCKDCNIFLNKLYLCEKCRRFEKTKFLYYLATTEMYCTYCGQAISSAKLCPHCGHKTYKDYKIYCRNGHTDYINTECPYCRESTKENK